MVYASLNEVPADPGRHRVRIPVTTTLGGMEVVVWAHVFQGARPGPTITFMSGLHGNEWLHLEAFRTFEAGLPVEELAGRVIVVPMANQVSFSALRRHLPDDSDNADANRAFPISTVKHTWVAEQIATVVAEEILAHADAMVDFHLGMWGATLGSTIVGNDYSDSTVNEASMKLAYTFGTPLIYVSKMVGHFPGPRSSQGYSGEVLKLPCCGSMLGGAGFHPELETAWCEGNVQGMRNILIHLGLLKGEIILPESYLVYERVQRVNPRVGGLLVPERTPESFGREVTAGELLGTVVSPFTFDVIEELRAPFDGYLAYWARSYPLHPGDWAYCVIPVDHPGTRWVQRPEL